MQVEQVAIESLKPYENNAREHSDQQVAQIAASIEQFGFNNPILIDKDNGVVAGHGRLMAAKKLGYTEVSCIKLGHLTESQKKAYILADNKIALNSTWNEELLKIELEAIGDLELNSNLTGFSVKEIDKLFEDPSDKYTKKVEIPSYEPSDKKPLTVDLYDKSKTWALLEAINSSNVDQEIKDFLKCAAYRHVEFNFENIADFYANSDKEVQKLFEESALVIIDLQDAIANNFIELNEELANQYLKDYDGQ